MRRSNGAVGWICAVWAGMLLTALSAWPAGAQSLWVALAISPATGYSGAAHGSSSQADATRVALQACQAGGARDCKFVSSGMQCLALATPSNPVPNLFGYSTGLTREGAAAQALIECAKAGGVNCGVRAAPCSDDDPRWASPLPLPPVNEMGPVDPALVGFWKMNVSNGIRVWQITAKGAYSFHSEAPDKTPPHAGQFSAINGQYRMHAISTSFDDQGTYTLSSAGVLVTTGKSGPGTWNRIAADPEFVVPAEVPAPEPAPKR
jgi:Domain of unknown function (DUF4189)